MIVTDPEHPAALRPAPQKPSPQRLSPPLLIAVVLVAGLAASLCGCVEEPLPQRSLTAGDCLLDLKLRDLQAARKRCDKVVAAFPSDPAPLNDRFLINSLLADNAAACADIRKAVALAARVPAATLDPLLRRDLSQRLSSCRD